MSHTSFGVIFLAISVFAIFIGVILVRKRTIPLTQTLLLLIFFIAVWTLSNAFHFFSRSNYFAIFWHELKFIGVVMTPVALLIFTIRYINKSSLVTKQNIMLVLILPIITLIFIFTNRYHGLFRQDINVVYIGTIRTIITKNGIWYWISTIYSYILILISIYLLVAEYFKLPKLHRGQVGIMLMGILVPFVINIQYVFFQSTDRIDITAILFVLASFAFFWALVYYKESYIIPLAKDFIIENMQNLVLVVDNFDNIIHTNPAAKKMFTDNGIDLISIKYSKEFSNTPDILRNFIDMDSDKKSITFREGENRHFFEINENKIYDRENMVIGTLVVMNDVTHLKKMMSKLENLAIYDQLTGMYNRTFFEAEIIRLDTERQLPLSIITGDVNGLKMINDAFGHSEGDIILKKIAQILKNSCRKEDIIARVGGDEFAILLPHTDENTAGTVIERIRQMCEVTDDEVAKPSIALGFATKKTKEQNIADLMKQADNSMYKKKLLQSKSIRSSIIESLQRTLEQSNYETKEHAQRTQEMAIMLGRVMGLNESQLDDLALLALLHDIGKLSIPDHILLKPGKLTEEEWDIIKMHPEKGYHIAVSSFELMAIADAILCHHERWDGRGYPQKLKGEEIPLLSRIITVIDSFDVMTHDRPYHKAVSCEEALYELKRCSGSQFDPQIVEAFEGLLNSNNTET